MLPHLSYNPIDNTTYYNRIQPKTYFSNWVYFDIKSETDLFEATNLKVRSSVTNLFFKYLLVKKIKKKNKLYCQLLLNQKLKFTYMYLSNRNDIQTHSYVY